MKKGFISLLFPGNSLSPKDAGQKCKQGKMLEAKLVHCLQACCSACLLTASRITSVGWYCPTVSWALPHLLSIKKMPHGLAHSQPGGGIFSTEVPLPKGLQFASSWSKTCQYKFLLVCLPPQETPSSLVLQMCCSLTGVQTSTPNPCYFWSTCTSSSNTTVSLASSRKHPQIPMAG